MCFILFRSGPLFTRQNPFPTATRVGKAQRYPSTSQSLSQKKKKTVCFKCHTCSRHLAHLVACFRFFHCCVLLQTSSPVRSKQQSRPQVHSVSTASQQLSDRRDHSFGATDGHPGFSESWPTTDCGSSPKPSATAGKSTELGVQQDSVLAKYALI